MSQQNLTGSTGELFDLIQKSDGIISTYAARDMIDESVTIENDYKRHADTHISLGDTGDFEERVYDKLVNDDQPTKGFLYGPFGYGKTSTAVSVWNSLTQSNVIAVPPFTLTSFSDIMRATYGWMRYQLEREAPSFVDQLEEIHDNYLQRELREYAKAKKDQYDISDINQLVVMFEEMEQDNELELSIQADTLIDFFDECTQLALEADFDGLVIIGDELQQYFKSADNYKQAEERFRNCIFAIHAGAQLSSEFGLLLSMPDQTKSELDTHAGDILNRLQRDNLTINLKNVYGQQFPANLWDRYADKFGFENSKHEVLTEHVLDAIGQICSRDDLSNGPRTVIDLFRIALVQHRDTGEAFTVLDLADAFYDGKVRYQGRSTAIQTAIGDALDHSSVDTADKEMFIKLCGVFPEEGVSDEVVNDFELDEARTGLSKDLHGDVIKHMGEGYVLTEVTRDDGPTDVVKQLVREFWRQYDDDRPNADLALEALANRALCGEVFEVQKGQIRGWALGDGLSKTNTGVYRDVLTGTSNARYPDRRLSVRLSDVDNQDDIIGQHGRLGERFGDPDLAFNIVLRWHRNPDHEVTPRVEKESSHEYTFYLNGKYSFDKLPNGIEFLRDAMDPNAVTPFLMLALVEFFEEDDTELDAAQRERVKSFQNTLLNKSIQTLFGKELIDNAPIEIRRTGAEAVEAVFTHAMEDLFPDYNTLTTSTKADRIFSDYMDFLDTLNTTAERRGNKLVELEKSDLVSRFNLNHNSGFEDRVRKHYGEVLELETWDGNDAAVRATLHPLEQEIVKPLEQGERDEYPLTEIEERAYEYGYRQEELDRVIGILSRRGIVGMNEAQDALIPLETDITVPDVEQTLSTCHERIELIETIDDSRVPSGVKTKLSNLETELGGLGPEDDEMLEMVQFRAQDVESRLGDIAEDLHAKYRSKCQDLKRDVERRQRNLIPSHLDKEIKGGVKFVGGLNEQRTDIKSQFQDLKNQLSQLEDDVDDKLRNSHDPSLQQAKELHEQATTVEEELEEIRQEKEGLTEQANTLKQWKTFTDQVAGVKEDIIDYSRTYGEDIEEKKEITDFIGQISEQLTTNPESAIENLEAYKEGLEQIESAYKERRRERREIFDEKRETLKTILQNASDGRAPGLRSAQFDIRNPQSSQRGLVDNFQEAYEKHVLDEAEKQLDDARQDIEYAQIVGTDTVADADADDVMEELEQAERQLQKLRTTVERFEFEDIGEENDLDTDGEDLQTSAKDLHTKAQSFLKKREPESDEVLDLLENINQHSTIDFKELLQNFHENGDNVSPEELLERMNQLFTLNQIDIKISTRRGR